MRLTSAFEYSTDNNTTTEVTDPSPAYSGDKALRIVTSSVDGSWKLEAPGAQDGSQQFNFTGPYTHLTFDIRGDGATALDLFAWTWNDATSTYAEGSVVSLSSYGFTGQTSWTTVSIPLTDLKGSLTEFGHLTLSFGDPETIYLDNIRFTRAKVVTFTCSSSQIGGAVFNDANMDGQLNGGTVERRENGIPGVTVKAYDVSGAQVGATAATDANGHWRISVPSGVQVRVEFTTFPTGYAESFNGVHSQTSVRFVTSPSSACDVNLGLVLPGQYSPADPTTYVTNQWNGNGNTSGTTSASTALWSFPYSAYGSTDFVGNSLLWPNWTYPGDVNIPDPAVRSTMGQIGSTWGLAYQKSTNRLYISAFLKRHVGYGPLGSGGIYVHTPGSTSASSFVNLQAIGINTGADTRTATPGEANYLPGNKEDPSWDVNALGLVGKRSIGDIDMSTDDQSLWVMNLNNRTLYKIFIGVPAQTPTASNVTAYALSNPGCSDDDWRPWATKAYQGKVYVGVTCTAETSQNQANLKGYVLAMPESGGFWSTVFTMPLIQHGEPDVYDSDYETWQPWKTAIPLPSTSDLRYEYPQPILSDIEFDVDGSMVLGLLDRFGHQTGGQNYSYDYPSTLLGEGGTVAGGDMVRVCNTGTLSAPTYALELNGRCSSSPLQASPYNSFMGATSAYRAEGPNNGEFYWGDSFPTRYAHRETADGGLALLAGSGQVVTSINNPLDWNSGGIAWFNNVLGGWERRYQINGYSDAYTSASFSKAHGLGDVELITPPAPLELGNRLWCDTGVSSVGAGNGIQDPGEAVIPNATVTLQCDTNGLPSSYEALISTTTDSNGHYLFKDGALNTSFPTATWDSSLRIIPRGAQCVVTVSAPQSAITTACGGASAPTLLNNGGTDAGADLRDNDGSYMSGTANSGVVFSTGSNGATDHSLDFGFVRASIDYGDAPDTAAGTATGNYNTTFSDNGPSHVIVSTLRMGATAPDADSGSLQNAAATADDTTLTPDDEDGVATLPSITTLSASVSLNVSVYSTSASTVACWIDFNRDGDFLGTGERASASVNASASQQTIPLTFSGFAAPTMGTSYLRCRIANTASEVTSPTGAATSGEVEDYQVSIALGRTGAIGNLVWVDENSDGYQDAGEPGLANVTVQLKHCTTGAVLATTVTDTDGGYLFSGLAAGTYCVDVLETSLPTGMTQTTITTNAGADFGNQNHSGNGYSVTIGGSGPWENLTADFGYNYNPTIDVNTPPSGAVAALGDRVWIDVDGDGFQDVNEVGIAGVTVQLYTAGADGVFGTADDVLAATTTTNAAGVYLFDGLTPGAYVVKATPPSGYTQTGDPDHFGVAGTVNDNQTTTPVVLGPGDVFLNADFGYQPPAAQNNTVGDTVWFDADADGVQDAGEYGMAGVTVALIRDADGDGVWDAGEPVIATDITDATGVYGFTGLPDGNYLVWVNDTDNVLGELRQTYDSDGLATPNLSAVALDPTGASATGVSNLVQDFGYTAASQTLTSGANGLIGDTVWFDLDNSGGATQGAGEPGIEGVVMQLLDSSGAVLATTATDENGHYSFGGLAVSTGGVQYRVRVAASNFAAGGVLQGMAETYAAGGTVGGNQGALVTLTTASPINLLQDFSYTTTTTPGRIGNLVWLDSNADGVFATTAGQSTDPNAGADDDEPVIGGVTVDLYRDLNVNGKVDAGEPRVSTQTTAGAINATTYGTDGVYLFSRLAAGAYVVNVTDTAGVLAGYWHSLGASGVNNNSQVDPYAVTLTAGADNLTADFGYYVEPACVGNLVWYDQDGDGLQDAGEPGLNGVTLQTVVSWPAGGTTTLKTVTGDNPMQTGTQVGWYSFCNLLLDEDYRVGSSTATPAANQPAHVASVAAAPAGYVTTLVGGVDSSETSLPLDDSNLHTGTVAVPVQGLSNVSQQTASSEPVIASYDFGYRVADWGDLPDSYNTTSAAAGAYHTVDAVNPAPRLGTCVDAESNGVASDAASGDDGANSALDFGGACSDDEDGVQFVNSWIDGTGDVLVSVSGATACLNAWMDFANNAGAAVAGGDTTFGDSAGAVSEWVIQNRVMAVGVNQLVTFPVPASLAAGNYYLRFRLTPNLGNTATCADDVTAYTGGSATWSGAAKGGEVEDYVLNTAPLAVTLASFDAAMQGDAVVVTWETVSEADNAGFTLYRSTAADGERVSLGFTPAAAPGATQGASYRFVDSDVVAGQPYFYWLEALDVNGAASVHGPVSVTVGAPTAVTLADLQAASGTVTPAWAVVLSVMIVGLGLLAARRYRQI